MALAYFITFTTYGTWLPGNAKGSVDDEHNVYGTSLVEADADREQGAREAMTQAPYVITAAERAIVCNAMVELARDRGWDLLAAHVRSNHVHVVVSAERDPGRLMSDLKSRASRDLALAGFADAKRRRWTRHGSTRHLFREEEVEAAVRYTLDEQGERMAWYAKVSAYFVRGSGDPRTN
jgi:REP element-mobilizing transposase RayT